MMADSDTTENDKNPNTGDSQPSANNSSGDSAQDSQGALNQQIVDAVTMANSTVLDAAGSEGAAVAYQKVTQATAFAIQDSTDYLRNIMTISSAATGVCLQKMIVEKTTDPYTDIIAAAAKAVTDAQTNFSTIGASAGEIATNFPAGSKP